MAVTSGQVRTYEVDDGTYFYVNWQQTSQDIANNRTAINYQYGIHCRWNYYSNSVRINGVNIANTNVKGSETYSGLTQGDHELGSGSLWIYHDNSGNRTFNINLSGWVIDGGDTSGSGDFTLTQIPRQANITSANNFNDEGTPTMSFSNPGGFTMNVWLEPNPTGTHLCIRNNIPNTGSYTWTLTEEERNQLRQACTGNSCTIRFGLYTIIGSSTYASYVDKTFSIVNGNPVFENFDFNDINTTTLALTGNSKTNVNGYSNIYVNITEQNKAVAQKQATMVKYRFVIGDKSVDIPYASTGTVSGTIENAPNGTYQVYAIDSRGNSTLVTKLATNVIDYQPIYINGSTSKAERNDSGIGENAILTFNGTMWNDNFGQVTNSIKSAVYEYKSTNSNTWITPSSPTDITPTLTDNDFNFSNLIRSDEEDYKFDLQTNYDFRITIEDELSTTTLQLTAMPSAVPNLCYADEGMSIMKDYNETTGGALQIGGDTYIDGDLSIGGNDISYLNDTKVYSDDSAHIISFTAPFTGILELSAVWSGWGYDGGTVTLSISNTAGNATLLGALSSSTSGHNTVPVPIVAKAYFTVTKNTAYSFTPSASGTVGGSVSIDMIGILRRGQSV